MGPRGSGRTKLLGSVVRSLDHARRPYLLFCVSAIAGLDVRAALQSLGQEPTVPRFPEAARRARHAAVRILRGWRVRHGPGHMLIVVDDIDAIDLLTRSVLAALLREPNVQVLAAGERSIEGLTTVEVPPLSVKSLPFVVTGSAPGASMHIGAAILHSASAQGVLNGAGGWNGVHLLEGLSENARRLIHLVATSVAPVPRAGAGRLLQLDLAEMARACSSLTHRGLVVEWSGGLRLASPQDAPDLEELLGVLPDMHRKAASLLNEAHPARVAHAVIAPPAEVDELHESFDTLTEWDPASTARWGSSIVRHASEPGLVRRTAEAAMAAQQRDVAVEVLRSAVQCADDLYVKVALLALAGLYNLTAPADIQTAQQLLREARSCFGSNPHPPAELYLLESKLHMSADRPAKAAGPARAARESVPVFQRTARMAQEHEGSVLAAMGRLDDADQVWSTLVRKADIPTRERVAESMAAHLKKAQRLLDASNAMVLFAHADREVPDAVQAKVLDKAALLALGGGDPGAAIAHWTSAIELAEQLHASSLAARIRPRLAAALR
ncbi:MAG TPA: hypothetical protein DFR83_02370, partial [Deltaproteobacteria bacterium]|nr:hypothetical protein [Deltaproteobacteria bacterium]